MLRHRLNRASLWLVIVAMFISLSAVSALAKTKKKEKKGGDEARIDAVLGDLEWGDSKKKVLEYIKDQRLDVIKADKKLRKDRVKMQSERQRILDWHKRVEESYTRFNGKEGRQYEVSLISGHYTQDNGESMLLARDKIAQRFFFFMDGNLYKVVIAYDQDYVKGVEFESFVGQSAKKYGRPVSLEYGELYGEDELVRATWEDKTSILELENQREFFATYSMVFSDRKRVKELIASERQFGGLGKVVDDSVSSEVAGLMRDDKSGSLSDPLAGLIGEVKIDDSKGRPKDAIDEPIEEPSKAPKESEEKEKKSTKRARPKAKKKVSGESLKDIDAGDDQELIIY